jgi:hypothetical protein
MLQKEVEEERMNPLLMNYIFSMKKNMDLENGLLFINIKEM